MTTSSNQPGLERSFLVSRIGEVAAGDGGFELRIDEPFRAGLRGLEDFSHVVVVWLAEQMVEAVGAGSPVSESMIVNDTPYVDGPSDVGVFSTRSPLRPSPVNISMCAQVAVDEASGVVDIGWIDAFDRTPIIDVKPYFPSSDRVREVRVPGWCASWPSCLEDSADFAWETVIR